MYKIFNSYEAEKIKKSYPFLKLSDPFWSPKLTSEQVTKITSDIYKEILLNYKIDISEYKFQILGITEGETQILYFNFFNNKRILGTGHPDLRRMLNRLYDLNEFVVVFDGGQNYLQVKYDPRQQVIIEVFIHGET